jgi:hypothetical protein
MLILAWSNDQTLSSAQPHHPRINTRVELPKYTP